MALTDRCPQSIKGRYHPDGPPTSLTCCLEGVRPPTPPSGFCWNSDQHGGSSCCWSNAGERSDTGGRLYLCRNIFPQLNATVGAVFGKHSTTVKIHDATKKTRKRQRAKWRQHTAAGNIHTPIWNLVSACRETTQNIQNIEVSGYDNSEIITILIVHKTFLRHLKYFINSRCI